MSAVNNRLLVCINAQAYKNPNLNWVFNGIGFSIHTNFQLFQKEIYNQSHFAYTEGTIYPRLAFANKYNKSNFLEGITNDYDEIGGECISKYKGTFLLVVGNKKEVNIFSDHLGVKKFFYTQKDGATYVSNDINLLVEIIKPKVNANHIAIYSVTNHFINGITIFNDIYYSSPACNLHFNGKQTDIKKHWSAEELFNSPKSESSYGEYANVFLSITKQYLDFYKPKDISLTLTGGSDSRIMLGALLHYGYKPKTYTFGNPKSGDVIVAKAVAEKLGLAHSNHFEANLSPSWFKNLTKEITQMGNSIINYHRTYRLDGLLKERRLNPYSEITILGHAGGEPIRGLFYDNLIVTDFLRNWTPSNHNKKEILVNTIEKRFINSKVIDLDYITNFLDNLTYLQKDGKEREFLIIFELLIANHLYQDLNLYHAFHGTVILPFMDIDYLNYLFTTQYSMIYKNNSSKNQFKRLNIPELHCNVINIIYPELTKFQLNNGYSPAEYLNNKYLYLIKRVYRKITKRKTEPNFYYGKWFAEYIENNWPDELTDSLKDVFVLENAKKKLKEEQPGITERYWIKFSSIIMLNELLKQY